MYPVPVPVPVPAVAGGSEPRKCVTVLSHKPHGRMISSDLPFFRERFPVLYEHVCLGGHAVLLIIMRLALHGLAALLLPSHHLLTPHLPRLPSRAAPRTSTLLHMQLADLADDSGGGKRRARRQRRQKAAAGKKAQTSAKVPQNVASRVPEEDQTIEQRAARFAKLEQPQKAMELYTGADDPTEAFPVVLRALLRMRRIELALELYNRHALESSHSAVDTRSTCALFLALCRARRLDEAATMLASLEVAHPPPSDAADRAAGREAALAALSGAAGRAASSSELLHDARAADGEAAADAAEEPLWHAIGAQLLPSLAAARLDSGDVAGALELAARLGQLDGSCMPPLHMITKLVRIFGKARCLPGVYACLDAQALARQEPDSEGLQVLVDALVRDVHFVKGGVSMQTLPDEPYPEVAFVGRSNVGKSSMVNMLLGRRAIAYTSKTPGKTQQYNYFLVNDGSGSTWTPSRGRGRRSFTRVFQNRGAGGGGEGDGELDALGDGEEVASRTRGLVASDGGPTGTFHLVDMPGLGFAKVPSAARRRWIDFIGVYAANRPQLRLLVHLIDGQIGPMETDLAIMRMVKAAYVGQAPGSSTDEDGQRQQQGDDEDEHDDDDEDEEAVKVQKAEVEAAKAEVASAVGSCAGDWEYAICLTKADKGGPKALKKAEAAVRKAIADVGCPEPVQIVPTSSRSKGGRADMWRLMRRVATEHRDDYYDDDDLE